MNKWHKKVSKILIYTEPFLVFCVVISPFASLLRIPIRIMISAIELEIRTTTAGIKKYKSIIKKGRINLIK